MNTKILTLKRCDYCGKRLKFLCSYSGEDGDYVYHFECKYCRQMAYLIMVKPKGGGDKSEKRQNKNNND